MPTRNSPVLELIISILDDLVYSPAEALARLEYQFELKLLIIAGDVTQVSAHAETLRLAITDTEAAQVLDHLVQSGLMGVTIEQVDEAINALFEDRFIEPGP